MKGVFRSLFAAAGLAAVLCCPAAGLAQTIGAAETFAVLGGQSVTAAGTGTMINGDVGVSPLTSITGFPAAATVIPPFTTHANDGPAIAAQTSVTALYTSLVPGSCDSPSLAELDGASFIPGTYCFASTAHLATNGTLTLNGAGTYIFQVGSSITAETGSNVVLEGGADACNVFWQVTEAATLNGATFVGNVVAQAGVTVGVGATLTGRALTTSNGAVSMAGSNTIGGCSVAATPSPTPASTETPTSGTSATQTGTPTESRTRTETRTRTPTRTLGPPILQIDKVAASSAAAGVPLIYVLTYRNIGGATATGVTITETVPDRTTFNAGASTSGWSCPDGSPPATICTMSVPDLPPGASAVVLFAVTVDASARTGVIRNTVIIASAEGSEGGSDTTTLVGGFGTAPTLGPPALAALLTLLLYLAWLGVRRVGRA